MSKYTKPIPLDELPETPAVYGEMIEEYNQTKKTVSRDIEVEGLGKGRLVLSKQNKGKPFFYADEANIEANQKAAKQLQTAETIANAPLLLAPFFSIAKGGQKIIKQRKSNQIKKSALAAENLDKVNNVIDLVSSRAKGVKQEIPSRTTAPTTSIMNMYKDTGLSPQQKQVLSTIVLQAKKNDMSDDELNELYKQRTNPDFYVTDPADPNYGKFRPDLEKEAKAKQKGEGDPTGIRSEQVFGNRSYWENLPKRSKSLFLKAGLTENDAIFFLSNFDKVTRDTAAALQDPDYTSGTFELMKKELLPGFLEEMKDVKGLKPQLDHINQLAAALPLYDGTTFKEREQLNKIIIGEGIYAGHSPGNLQYLDLRVHTVKSNYFNDLVGKDGMKFFGTKDLSTFEKKIKAAKEYAAIVKNSYKIVEDANKANLALYKQNLTPEEVTALLFEINPYTKYTIRDLKRIIEELKGITDARSEANALDLMLTVAEGMSPAEFFKMTGSGPKGQRKLPTIKQLKNAAFDDKFYQPLLDESFNYLE